MLVVVTNIFCFCFFHKTKTIKKVYACNNTSYTYSTDKYFRESGKYNICACINSIRIQKKRVLFHNIPFVCELIPCKAEGFEVLEKK